MSLSISSILQEKYTKNEKSETSAFSVRLLQIAMSL